MVGYWIAGRRGYTRFVADDELQLDLEFASPRDESRVPIRATGVFSVRDYERYVLPHARHILDGLADLGVPRIHFGVGTGELLGLMAEAGADVVGVDWRVPLDEARRRIPEGVGTQGNLEPAACLADWDTVEARVRDVLRRAGGRADHVFNLGHGVLPSLDPAVLARVVTLVHDIGRTDGSVPEPAP